MFTKSFASIMAASKLKFKAANIIGVNRTLDLMEHDTTNKNQGVQGKFAILSTFGSYCGKIR